MNEINPDKAVQFFNAVISMTKNHRLKWSQIALDARFYGKVDGAHSFVAHYKNGEIALLRRTEDGAVFCRVSIDMDKEQIGTEDDPTLLRLYNIVYSQFPSITSFVDDFISDSQQ